MNDQKQIIEAIAEHLAIPTIDIDTEDLLREDLGLNPVEITDLISYLSEKFKVVFDQSEISQIKTAGNLIELIEDKMLE